jgi:hypothetical protein
MMSKARSWHRFDMVLARRGGAAAKRRPNDVRMMSKARSRHRFDMVLAHRRPTAASAAPMRHKPRRQYHVKTPFPTSSGHHFDMVSAHRRCNFDMVLTSYASSPPRFPAPNFKTRFFEKKKGCAQMMSEWCRERAFDIILTSFGRRFSPAPPPMRQNHVKTMSGTSFWHHSDIIWAAFGQRFPEKQNGNTEKIVSGKKLRCSVFMLASAEFS